MNESIETLQGIGLFLTDDVVIGALTYALLFYVGRQTRIRSIIGSLAASAATAWIVTDDPGGIHINKGLLLLASLPLILVIMFWVLMERIRRKEADRY